MKELIGILIVIVIIISICHLTCAKKKVDHHGDEIIQVPEEISLLDKEGILIDPYAFTDIMKCDICRKNKCDRITFIGDDKYCDECWLDYYKYNDDLTLMGVNGGEE